MKLRPEINKIIAQATKPLTYVACEDGAYLKKKASAHICLIYPDLYELGIGSLGINILYSILNNQQDVWAQRAYMPDLDVQQLLQKENTPLFSLEEQRPLSKFDILGFSLPHELCYTNILKILELSHISIRSADRSEDHPIIIAGGNGALNPLPLRPFIDAFVIGDGEEVIIELVQAIRGERREARDKKLKSLSGINGVWVPQVHRGTVPRSVKRGLSPIKKRTITDINTINFKPLIPTSKGEKRLVAEIMRGCTSGCRFCQAGFINRPLREKDANKVFNQSIKHLSECGLNQLSLLSLSTSDYSLVEPLVGLLAEKIKSKNISISLPSLRLDDFSVSILRQISSIKKTGLTFAIEAGSQRLRDLINKRLSEEQIIKTLGNVFAQGWTKVKLYFMIGLPTEQNEDLWQIVEIVKKIKLTAKQKLGKQRKKLKIVVSVSNYVPKPHTPFQWCAQDDVAVLQKKHRFLMENIRGPAFSLRWHNAEQSILEGLLARGDEKVALVIEQAYKKGAQFDNFSERFDFNAWQRSLEECSINISDYLRQRELDEPLPWDFIDCGVAKEFLKEENYKAFDGKKTEDCRDEKCPQCGVCNKELKNIFSGAPSSPRGEGGTYNNHPAPGSSLREGEKRDKYRLFVKREGLFKYLSHLEWINLLERRLRQADLGLASKGKYNPRPKLSYSQALPVGSEEKTQHVDFTIINNEPVNEIEKKLMIYFNEGLKYEHLESIC